MLRGASVAGLILLLAVFGPARLAGQVVEGRVLEDGTNQPVTGAAVELLWGRDRVMARGTTDEEGRFRLRAPGRETYRIRAGRIGYETVTTPPFDLIRDDEPFEVEVFLGTEAIPLAPMEVISERPARVEHLRLHLRGFYDRQRRWGREGMGFGQFRGPEELERRILFEASDVAKDLRGMRVVGAGGRRQAVRGRGGRCTPRLYIDGVRIREGAAALDALVHPSEILGVEVYVSIGPPEFSGDGCGSIVIWTGMR
jgi:hypothetical protein